MIKTVISFDKGGYWEQLSGPRIDSLGRQNTYAVVNQLVKMFVIRFLLLKQISRRFGRGGGQQMSWVLDLSGVIGGQVGMGSTCVTSLSIFDKVENVDHSFILILFACSWCGLRELQQMQFEPAWADELSGKGICALLLVGERGWAGAGDGEYGRFVAERGGSDEDVHFQGRG